MTTFPRQQNLVLFLQSLFGKCHRLQSQTCRDLPFFKHCLIVLFVISWFHRMQFNLKMSDSVTELMSRSANSRTGIAPFLRLGTVLL